MSLSSWFILIHQTFPRRGRWRAKRPGPIPGSPCFICLFLWVIVSYSVCFLPTEATLKNPRHMGAGEFKGWTGTEREDTLWYFTWCQWNSSLSLFPSPSPYTPTHMHGKVICLRISRLLHLWWPCVVGRGWVESVSFLNYSPTRNLSEFSRKLSFNPKFQG